MAPTDVYSPAALVAGIGALLVACGPGKQELSGTGTSSTGDATDASTSTTSAPPGSLSHSATSVGSVTADPDTTGDASTAADATTTGPITATATSTGDGGSTTSGTPDPGGSVYGPCEAVAPQCQAGLECFALEGIVGSFCGPPCGPQGQCPASGVAAAAECVLALDIGQEPTHCALICDPTLPDPGCPAGTSCKVIPTAPPDVGICTAP